MEFHYKYFTNLSEAVVSSTATANYWFENMWTILNVKALRPSSLLWLQLKGRSHIDIYQAVVILLFSNISYIILICY